MKPEELAETSGAK